MITTETEKAQYQVKTEVINPIKLILKVTWIYITLIYTQLVSLRMIIRFFTIQIQSLRIVET